MRQLFGLLLLLASSPAFAEDVYCNLWTDLARPDVEPTLYQVKVGTGKAFFQSELGGEGYGCPGEDKRCRANAYLIDGDAVVVTSEQGDYACATFTNDGKENIATNGWLPKADLEPVDLPAARPQDFVGTWRYFDEQEIVVSAGHDGTLSIAGEATYGMHDPQRVASGGVNVGSIAAELKPEGNLAAWTTGDDGEASAWEEGEADYRCAVRLWALPPFLVASDNRMCGGHNVTFTGVYAHAD